MSTPIVPPLSEKSNSLDIEDIQSVNDLPDAWDFRVFVGKSAPQTPTFVYLAIGHKVYRLQHKYSPEAVTWFVAIPKPK